MAEENEEAAESKPKSKLPLIIGAVVLLLVLGGGAAFMFMGGSAEDAEDEAEVVEIPQVYEMLQFMPFYVNLSETTNFLKLVMSVQYNKTALETILMGDPEEGGGDAAKEAESPDDFLEAKKPILRDAVLQLLSSKNLKDVLSLEGKELMKEELVEVLNESLEFEDEVFSRVLFQDFLVQ